MEACYKVIQVNFRHDCIGPWDPLTFGPLDLGTLGPLASSNTSSCFLLPPLYLLPMLLFWYGLLWRFGTSALVLFWVFRLRLEMDQYLSLTIATVWKAQKVHIILTMSNILPHCHEELETIKRSIPFVSLTWVLFVRSKLLLMFRI